MNEHIVDARGELCPKPLILTKCALKECEEGQPVKILIDNETSKTNVMRFLTDNGYSPECIETDGVFTLSLFGASTELSHPDAARYCSTGVQAPHVIAVKSNRMGEGEKELGELLIKAFISTITEVSPLPGTIVFYNSGIFLACNDSPVIDALKQLETQGVTILVCGTCADYYNKKAEISIGTISNMYTILETLTAAGNVIEP